LKRIDLIEENEDLLEETEDKEDILISVVVPVYNVDSYIERCLKSVTNQTYKKLQIIVIDDGSTDGTEEICQNIAQNDKRITFIKNEHKGVVVTRNTGIEQATGKYITFVDADDWVEADYIENMVNEIGECDLLIPGYMMEDNFLSDISVPSNLMDRGQSRIQYIHVDLQEGIYENADLKILWKYMFFNHEKMVPPFLWGKLFKTSMIKQIYQLVDPRIWRSEDRVLTHIYLTRCESVKIMAPLGYHYCVRNNEGINKRYDNRGILANCEIYYHCLKKAFCEHPYKEELLSELDVEFAEFIRNCAMDEYGLHKGYKGPMGYYPYYGRLEGKRVILYGAGNVGKLYRRHILQDKECTLVAWVDRDAEKYRKENLDVINVECIMNEEYDYLIVAVAIERVYLQIKESLQNMGVPKEKILWNQTKWGW